MAEARHSETVLYLSLHSASTLAVLPNLIVPGGLQDQAQDLPLAASVCMAPGLQAGAPACGGTRPLAKPTWAALGDLLNQHIVRILELPMSPEQLHLMLPMQPPKSSVCQFVFRCPEA